MYNYSYSRNKSNIYRDKSVQCGCHPIESQRRLEICINSFIDELNFYNFDLVISLFKKVSQDNSLQVDYIDQSSYNLIVNGSDQELIKLEKLFTSGDLEEFLKNIKTEYFSQVIIESVRFREDIEVIKKCQLIQKLRMEEIDKNRLIKDYLTGVDLSGANLQGINLSWANLSKANLSGCNLSYTDLSWANLSYANLSNCNLNNAILQRSCLNKTKLTNVDFNDANVINARFADNQGINDELKNTLIQRGAFFDN